MPGNDLAGMPILMPNSSAWDCGKLCKTTTECKAFSYKTIEKKCYLKSTDSGTDSQSNTVSGLKNCGM